jgi:hypothetical protein
VEINCSLSACPNQQKIESRLRTGSGHIKKGREMPLERFEKETTINLNEADKNAYIYTRSVTWQKHLEQKLGLKPTKMGHGGKSYKLSKKLIPFPKKPKKEMTPAQKQARLKNLKKAQGVNRKRSRTSKKTNAVGKK